MVRAGSPTDNGATWLPPSDGLAEFGDGLRASAASGRCRRSPNSVIIRISPVVVKFKRLNYPGAGAEKWSKLAMAS
ncbi:hypothetical protein MTP99_005860 [Tenebrio molitor]|nr:hypothetical protein MTP99_005860 [Tenebrio molitor]